MNKRKKKKLLKNLICVAYCSLQLLVVVIAFKGLGVLIEKITGKDIREVFTAGIMFDKEEEKKEEEEEKYLFTVCLDAGHGGKDNGSDNGARFEKNDALRITNAVAAYLKEQQVKVVMTREDDTFLKLSERCDIANTNQVDYFVSLHRNSGEGNGVEIWISTDAGEDTVEMADRIMDALNVVGISRNRGVRKGTQQQKGNNYYINAHSNMPSCIIELGFMNSPADNQLFDDKLNDYAKAVGDAVIATYQSKATGSSEDGNGAGVAGNTANSQGTPANAGNSQGAGGDGSSEDTGVDAVMEDSGTGANAGRVENFTPIENVASLSNNSMDWGQGTNVDDKNRPEGSITAQTKYGSYEAYFIDDKMEDKIIYLTFDEGYEYGCSPSILNTLKEKGVKAVFFLTEPYAKDQPELVQRMIDEGHTLGNHSVTHPSSGMPSLSMEKQENEVMENHRYIKDNFGYDMHLFRYPAGKFSEQSLAIVHNCGYKSVFWSFAYLDYDVNNQPEKAASLQKMLDRLHPGAIYLLHAESETNTAVLGEFIDRARAAGYEFAAFD